MSADLATFVGAGPAVEWRCPLCPRNAMEHYQDGWTHARRRAVAVLMDGGDR